MLKFLRSLRHALSGIVHAARSEANMRWHLVIAVIVIVASFTLQVPLIEWALVIGCIGGVLALECINTSIERLADRVTGEQDPLIQQAKDLAAGAVLAMAVTSATIGLIVFVPKIWALVASSSGT